MYKSFIASKGHHCKRLSVLLSVQGHDVEV